MPSPDPSAGDDDERITALIRDGSSVDIVAIHPDDAGRLVRFHRTLSAETTHRRFFSVHPELTEAEVTRFTTVDHVDRVAFVAVHDGEIVGVARFERLASGGPVAEVAFVVADSWQGRGLGTALFGHLLAATRRGGVRKLTADVLAENRAMLTLFRHTGLTMTDHRDGGVVHVSLTWDEPQTPSQ